MQKRRAALSLVAATALSVPLFGLPAGADEPAGTGWDRNVLSKPMEKLEPAAPSMAAGVIVKTRGGIAPEGLQSAFSQSAGITLQAGASAGPEMEAFSADRPISVEQAQEIADKIAERPDVEWAEPDLILQHTAAWPSRPNDTYTSKMFNIWDQRDSSHPEVAAWRLNAWPHGGYGTKAPAMWKSTAGAGQRVAVLDTGIRPNHPDLKRKLAGGYDMISNRWMANDGNRRDRNFSDPGDWTRAGACGSGSRASNSSWHGTHVAGTIGAVTNNKQGVPATAPGVRLQTVRVLGRCGGTTADIAAGIRWAAGVKVKGAPRNRRPSKILNLSLGGRAPYCPTVTQKAINAARRKGAIVVVALGNNAENSSGFTPANCNGVVGVHSHSRYGDAAAYSNFGPHADVSAPGGDFSKGTAEEGVLSTLDTGRRGPGQPTLAYYNGTSMATPAAAGVAALLRAASENRFRPASLERALRAATRPFPRSGRAGFRTCNARCGAGALDATRIPAAVTRPTILGKRRMGRRLRVGNVVWTGPAVAKTVTWRSGRKVIGRGRSVRIPRSKAWQRISVRVTPARGPFRVIGKTSKRIVVPGTGKQTSTVRIGGKRKVRARKPIRRRIIVRAVGIRPRGVVRVYLNGRRVQVKRLRASDRGRVMIRNRFRKGKNTLKVVYSGNKRIKKSQRTITVRGR